MAGGGDRQRAEQRAPLDRGGEETDGRTSKRRKVRTTSAKAVQKPQFDWLAEYTGFSLPTSAPTFCRSSPGKVTLSGSMDSGYTDGGMLLRSCGQSLLTNATIRWKLTKASSTAAGIWLEILKHNVLKGIPKGTFNRRYVTMLMLFKAPHKEYASAEEVTFSRKPDDDAEMLVKGVPAGYISFHSDITWRTNVKWRASSPQPNEQWKEGPDTSLSIIYFARFASHARTGSHKEHEMEVTDERCFFELDPSHMTTLYVVTLKMDAYHLRIELNKSRRILLLTGTVCKEVRTILIESDSNFQQLFSQPPEEMGNSGSNNGSISITLQIPLLDFNDRNQGKLENHVFQSETRNCIIDDTQSTFKKNGSTPSFTVYELIRISSASEK
eukprot:GHVS01101873.1.p1 GENE.GHVS01101873.1~~GHVS01101873.1.p1  ORF type:complete len:383 (+),score=15.92 GHVS01101873.1:228-1376(+)